LRGAHAMVYPFGPMGRARILQVLAALVVAVAAPSAAARASGFPAFAQSEGEQPRVQLSADGETLYVSGTLAEGSYLKVSAAARKAPRLRRLYLSSYGGLTVEGRMIALLVRQRGLDTYVEHACSSACTMAFIAGRERIAGPDAKFGFHQGYSIDDDGRMIPSPDARAPYAAPRGFAPVVGIGGTVMMRLTYEAAGIDPDFIARALRTPSETMWHPPLDQLETARVVTRRAAAPELAPPPGFGKSLSEIESGLADVPLWAALRVRSAEQYGLAAREVWREANSGLRAGTARWKGRTLIVDYAQTLMSAAPDLLLDQFVGLYGEMAASERARNYAGCRIDNDLVTQAPGPDDIAFAAREDLLLIRLFSDPARGTAPAPGQAAKDFRKAAGQLVRTARFDLPGPAGRDDGEYKCRIGLQTMEGIAALDRRRRLKAYRALLALPDEAVKDGTAATEDEPAAANRRN